MQSDRHWNAAGSGRGDLERWIRILPRGRAAHPPLEGT